MPVQPTEVVDFGGARREERQRVGLNPEARQPEKAGELRLMYEANPMSWLIEQAGFSKGHRHGKVGLSSKHALAVVNRGGGTAREVRELVAAIREGVESRFGVRLQPEPNLVGPPGFAWEGTGT